MLDRSLKQAHAPRGGPARPFLDDFAAALSDLGYSADSRRRYLCAAAHLASWAARRNLALADLDEGAPDRVVAHLRRRRGRSPGPKLLPRLRYVLSYLRKAGVITTRPPEPDRLPVVTEYVAWMRDHQGLAASTILNAERIVTALLAAVGTNLARLDAVTVRTFVLEYVRLHAPASAGVVTTTVRSFLRYLIVQGRCAPELVGAVPKVPTWSLSRLPRYLPDDDVERIIAASGREGPTARRDQAMVLLLARLGLRGSDVVSLRVSDLDWEEGRLRVVGKSRREARLPLPQDAGDAILAYLELTRPATTDRLFLTTRSPVRPLSASGLRATVSRIIERAGVRTPHRGTHLLRHSLATRLLRGGASLDTIGAILRHRDPDTTALYAKVDVGLLQQVAQRWPGTEVSPC